MKTLRQEVRVVNSDSGPNYKGIESCGSVQFLAPTCLNTDDIHFPVALKGIPQAPKHIFLQGCFFLDRRYIAIVGTRQPDAWGLKVAQAVASTLIEHGFGVVSGLAEGIDTCAHQTALTLGGHTLAVLPSGMERIYPFKNTGLAKDIVLHSGGLFSEYEPSTCPCRASFIQRNRLISGLCEAVVFVQGQIHSGSMSTVRLALSQGRRVFVATSSSLEDSAIRSSGNLAIFGKKEAFGSQVPTQEEFPEQIFSIRSSRELLCLL